MPYTFTQRAIQSEIMDDLNLSGAEMEETLYQLALINHWLGGHNIAWNCIQRLYDHYPLLQQKSPITIADVGCGGGDTLLFIAKCLRRRGIQAKLIGFDANPHILAYARRQSIQYPEITFEQVDMFSSSFRARTFDILLFNLILHHFDNTFLTTYISQMCKQATFGVGINDLHRHWLAYRLFQGLTWICGANSLTRNDGLLSIRKGFSMAEWRHLVSLSGIQTYQIQWKWAFRHQLLIFTK